MTKPSIPHEYDFATVFEYQEALQQYDIAQKQYEDWCEEQYERQKEEQYDQAKNL